MKQTSKMVMVAVALLAGVSGNAWANGTEIPPPEPSPYTPPPPPMETPAPEPVVTTGPYISGAIGIGIPGSFRTEFSPAVPYVRDHEDHHDGDRDRDFDRNRDESREDYDRHPPVQPDQTDTDNGSRYSLESGLVLNGAVGYNFGSTRLEGAVGYQQHDFSDSEEDISLLTLMANAYYDFDAGSGIRPYLMGGLGMAHVNMSWTDEDENVFAWQVGAGLGIKLAERTTLDLGYRYLKPNKFDTHDLGDGKLAECHNFMLGLRYQF